MTHPATWRPTGDSAESRWLLPLSCQSVDGKYWYYTVQQPYLGYLSVSKAPAEEQLQQIIRLPSGLDTRTQTHTCCTLARNLKITKDRCVSRLHFIILYGMQHSGDGVQGGGNKNQIAFLCGCVWVCVFVCVLEQRAWHYVSWFWMGRQTQMVFQGLYGGWWL